MLTAVYLDKLAEAVAPVSRLVGLRESRFLRQPDTSAHHAFADGLFGKADAVDFFELLPGQSGPEVAVELTYEVNDAGLDLLGQLAASDTASPFRDEPTCTVTLVRYHKVESLVERTVQAARLPIPA